MNANPTATRRIMVADDDPFIIALYQSKLRKAGFAVDTVSDGAEAIQKLESGGAPDLLLLDLNMPRIDGLQVLRHIRAHPDLMHLPVIVLSNACAGDFVQEVWKAAPTRFLVKRECSPNTVINEILKVLGAVRSPGFPGAASAPEAAPAAEDGLAPEALLTADLLRAFVREPSAEKRRESLLSLYQLLQPRLRHCRSHASWTRGAQFGEAMDGLFEDLYARPESVNPSSERTLAQGVERLLAMRPADAAEPPAPLVVLLAAPDAAARESLGRLLEQPFLRGGRVPDPARGLALLEENRFDLALFDGAGDAEMALLAGRLRAGAGTAVLWTVPLAGFADRMRRLPNEAHEAIAMPASATELRVKVYCMSGRPVAVAARPPDPAA